MAEHIPELLAPAGSYEAAMAALCNGADAIYLGAVAFGARASAGFSQQELKQVIDLYHFYGRRVYVTVNTLVKQREVDGVRDTLRMLSDLRGAGAGSGRAQSDCARVSAPVRACQHADGIA